MRLRPSALARALHLSASALVGLARKENRLCPLSPNRRRLPRSPNRHPLRRPPPHSPNRRHLRSSARVRNRRHLRPDPRRHQLLLVGSRRAHNHISFRSSPSTFHPPTVLPLPPTSSDPGTAPSDVSPYPAPLSRLSRGLASVRGRGALVPLGRRGLGIGVTGGRRCKAGEARLSSGLRVTAHALHIGRYRCWRATAGRAGHGQIVCNGWPQWAAAFANRLAVAACSLGARAAIASDGQGAAAAGGSCDLQSLVPALLQCCLPTESTSFQTDTTARPPLIQTAATTTLLIFKLHAIQYEKLKNTFLFNCIALVFVFVQ